MCVVLACSTIDWLTDWFFGYSVRWKSCWCDGCTADYQRWTVYPRRAKTVPKYQPPDCQFDGDSSYRRTYMGQQGDRPPPIVRPPATSLPLLTSEVPFDGRTNYRDEFTGHLGEPVSVVPDSTELEHTGLVLHLWQQLTHLFYNICLRHQLYSLLQWQI